MRRWEVRTDKAENARQCHSDLSPFLRLGGPPLGRLGNTNWASEFASPTAKAMGHPSREFNGVGLLVGKS